MKTNLNFKNNRLPDYLDTSNPNITEEEVLKYLASILSDIYLKEHHPDAVISKEVRDILDKLNSKSK
ncbi:MAG: hypothetical protein KBC11_00250 [Candidatus Pacebacteria bacterium]|nr:hypothetical protein [Candidatus Paceibacterota bacterium]